MLQVLLFALWAFTTSMALGLLGKWIANGFSDWMDDAKEYREGSEGGLDFEDSFTPAPVGEAKGDTKVHKPVTILGKLFTMMAVKMTLQFTALFWAIQFGLSMGYIPLLETIG